MTKFNKELAIKHTEQYSTAIIHGASGICLAIEKYYGFAGYPPEIVSVGLSALCDGECPYEAIDNYISGE